jgi:hypothetical protein
VIARFQFLGHRLLAAFPRPRFLSRHIFIQWNFRFIHPHRSNCFRAYLWYSHIQTPLTNFTDSLYKKLTPWSKVILKNLIVTTSRRTRRFITVFTTAFYYTLSPVSWIQSIPSLLRPILILSSHPPSQSFKRSSPPDFPTNICKYLISACVLHVPPL